MPKPLKDKNALKEETLALLKKEQEENKKAEERKKAAAAAQAAANKEADLIGAKDAKKLNPVIEKVPAKSSAAEKAKNSSLTQNSTEVKQSSSDSVAKKAGAQGGIDKIEAAKVEKATAQAKKNKEKDLPGFDGYAYQRQLAEQKEAERLEYLNIKEARDKKYALEQELEKAKAQAKAETAKAGTVQIVSSGINSGKNSFVSPETQKRINELEKQISDLNKDITLADRSQSRKYLYNRATSAADFEEFSKEQAKEEKALNPHQQNIQRETETVKGYMTDEEKAVYNYYLNKFGKEKAEEYFDSIREELNYRQAQAIFAGNEGKVLNEYIQGAAAGLESAKAGYKGSLAALFGIEKPQPTSTFDFVSQMAREDLAETGFKLPEALGGSSIGQIGFDYVSTYANMLPSMLLGTLGGGAVGAVAIGASAAGNAYNSAIKEGYSEEQARNYAALVGGSEAALGYVLGGIKSTGGKISNAVLGKLLPKIDNALAKTAVNVGGKYLSEMGEEYLQEILTPVFGNIALMEENKIDLLSPEAIYAGILGGLSAAGIAVFDGGANVPEVLQKAEVPVPFEGKAQPGTEAELVANKISEIENSSSTESEKAERLEKVMEKVAEITGTPEVIAETEKIKNYHIERQAEFDEAVEIGKRLGVSVELDPNIAGNGIHTSDGRIIINPNTENPALQVFVHELTHDIETSGLYANFSEKILSHVSENYDVDKIRQMVIEDYKAAGHNLTDTQANAEIVAKYCEQHLFTDEKAIQRLLDTDRNLFQKIKDWIHDMIVKFKGAPEERFLLEAERLYEKALATRGEVSGIDSESVGRGFDELAKTASQEEKIQHIDAAKKYFGTTYSWNETGYITTDGARLDFSGRHEGGRGGYRSVDHRDIIDALGDDYGNGNYSGGLVRFMGEGNIRLSPESGGINLSVMPTQAQLERLSDYISRERGEVILDIDDLNGNTISSTEYPKHTHSNKVLADIKNYFENGILPEGSESETAQWRYSTGRGFDEMAGEAKLNTEYEDTVPSFVRADINRIVNDPSITNEQKFYDLMALYDSAKTPAEKSEIGRYIYQMKTMPTERKPFFGIKNQASFSTKKDTEQNATFVPERGIETPEGINLLDEEVETNIGKMPVEDYREILAMQNGFESYEQMQAEARAMEEQDRKEEEWRKEQAAAQMREIIREGRSRRFIPEEAKAEHGVAEGVSAEIYNSAKNVMALKPERPKQQTAEVETSPEPENVAPVEVPQSEKSKRIERRFLRAVEDGVSSVFGIDRSEIKSDIRPILEEMAADIKNGNKITDEQIEKLYKTAFNNGYIIEEFPMYEEIRKYIREHPIYVSQENRNEFGEDKEFYNFMRSNFGSIKATTDPGAMHLDEYYEYLSEREPGWFDREETDPKTQLESIAEFMQKTKKQYKGPSEYYSGSELTDFEAWAKDQLKAYMEDFGKGLDTVARYERDRQIKADHKAKEMNPEASFEQAKAAFAGNKVFNLQKELEKVKAKHLLNDVDVLTVKKLLAGTMNEADVMALGGNVEGILDVYNAEKAYKEARAPFDRYAIAFKQSINHDAINALERSDEFKDKKGKLGGAALSVETAERNVRDIAGDEADKIIENYFNNVHEHEAMSNRFMAEMNQRVKDLEIGKMNRWERAYAQMIGENAKYIAMGKITKHNQAEHDLLNSKIQDLLNRHGNKIDKEKCEKAAAGFMGIYQDIFEKINDERIRVGLEPIGYIENYFPHFVEAKPETVFQKFFSKVLGMDVGDSKLPTDIAGKTADRKPGKKWNPHTLERKGDVTDYDILKGFDGYLRLAAHNIYHTEDIKKLRALSETIRTKYASTDLEKRIEELMNNKALSETDRSELIQKAISEVPDIYHLSNFVVWLDEYTNILAGKKSYGDRDAEYLLGREMYDVSKAIEGRIASNMVGYNLTTPFMNTIPLFQATADIPPQNIISSVVQTGIAALKKDSFISDNSDFITNRLGIDTLYKQNYNIFEAENMKDFVAKVSDGGGFLMGYADRIVSESLVRARYEQNLKNGMDKVSAFSEADQWAAGLIADRSLGAMPTIMNRKNPIIKAFTMFQLEQANQYSYIFKDAGKYKWKKKGAMSTISGQIAFWLAMALAGDLAKELLNKEDAVPNPVGITKDVVEKVQKGEKVGNIVLDTATNIVKQIPYVGGVLGGGRVPVATALPDWQQLFQIFDKEENVSWEKKQDILVNELLKPMSYILLPSGAGQLWKTGKGIGQLAQGGAYGIEADGSEYLKFPQKYDAESIIKTLVFGQYGSDAGQNYIDSGFKDKLSAKQTEQMKVANIYGISKEEFYETILGLKPYSKKEDKQKALLDNPDLDAKTKEVIDMILFGKPSVRAAELGYVEPTRSYASTEDFYLSGLSEGDRRLAEIDFSYGEIKKINKAIGKGKNKGEDIANIQDVLDCNEAEAYEIYSRKEGKWIDELSGEDLARAELASEFYGMNPEEYLAVLNYSNFGSVVDGEYSSSEKNVIPNLAKVLGVTEKEAEELYDRVNNFSYSREDLEEEKVKELQTMQDWYDVDDKGYFIAKNAIAAAKGTKDKFGNTVSGSAKAEAVENISKQLGISKEEATIYYCAAKGELVLSSSDLTSAKQNDLAEAMKHGWSENQFINAVNIIKVSGAKKKDDIINALLNAGASYEMALGYYNLSENNDYYKGM